MRVTLGAEFHTFTMIGRCAKTGLLGICMTSSPLCVAARCPFIKANLAAVATQAYSDPALGPLALNLLEAGYTVERTIEEMCANDEWTEYRQHGVVDRNGRSAAFTGTKNLDWKGHLNGPNYVAMGNYLTNDQVVEAMAKAFVDGAEILEERLLRAIEAGRDAGGEKGGHLSSGLLVYGGETYPRTDLRVDMYPSQPGQPGDAVDELRRIFNVYKPLIRYYEERPRNPHAIGWRDWIKTHSA